MVRAKIFNRIIMYIHIFCLSNKPKILFSVSVRGFPNVDQIADGFDLCPVQKGSMGKVCPSKAFDKRDSSKTVMAAHPTSP